MPSKLSGNYAPGAVSRWDVRAAFVAAQAQWGVNRVGIEPDEYLVA